MLRDAQALDEKDEPSEEEDDEFDDDDFMKSYRDKRRAELTAIASLCVYTVTESHGLMIAEDAALRRPVFGKVKEIEQLDLVSETDDEDKRVWVLVHIYEDVRDSEWVKCWCETRRFWRCFLCRSLLLVAGQ